MSADSIEKIADEMEAQGSTRFPQWTQTLQWAERLRALPSRAELERDAGDWQQYAKDGETAQAVIERERADSAAFVKLYLKDKTIDVPAISDVADILSGWANDARMPVPIGEADECAKRLRAAIDAARAKEAQR